MTNRDDAIAAGKLRPSARTTDQQRMVDNNRGSQAVSNANHAAERQERIHGKAK